MCREPMSLAVCTVASLMFADLSTAQVRVFTAPDGIQDSANATGTTEFIQSASPVAALFASGGAQFVVDEWQRLAINVETTVDHFNISLTPVDASGAHEIVGQQITLAGGGQEVTLEVHVAQWDPDLDGTPPLNVVQATLLSTGFAGENADPPNPGADLVPIGWPAQPELGAYIAQQFCNGGTLDGEPCGNPGDGPFVTATECTAEGGLSCATNPDLIFFPDSPAVYAVAHNTLDFDWGAAVISLPFLDDGTTRYLGTLTLTVPADAEGTYTLDLDPATTYGVDPNGVSIEPITLGSALIAVVSSAQPCRLPGPPHDVHKNRYISFDPANGVMPVAFQVTLPDTRTCWVGEPCLRADTGNIDPQWVAECNQSATGDGSDMVRVWSGYLDPETDLPVVHVRGCVILPDETYDVRSMSASAVGTFTFPLTIGTVPNPTINGSWADCVGDFDTGTQTWGAPDSNTSFKDIAAGVQGFQQVLTAPVTWLDMVPGGVDEANYILNFADIGAIIQGFQNVPYPGTVAACVIPAVADACP